MQHVPLPGLQHAVSRQAVQRGDVTTDVIPDRFRLRVEDAFPGRPVGQAEAVLKPRHVGQHVRVLQAPAALQAFGGHAQLLQHAVCQAGVLLHVRWWPHNGADTKGVNQISVGDGVQFHTGRGAGLTHLPHRGARAFLGAVGRLTRVTDQHQRAEGAVGIPVQVAESHPDVRAVKTQPVLRPHCQVNHVPGLHVFCCHVQKEGLHGRRVVVRDGDGPCRQVVPVVGQPHHQLVARHVALGVTESSPLDVDMSRDVVSGVGESGPAERRQEGAGDGRCGVDGDDVRGGRDAEVSGVAGRDRDPVDVTISKEGRFRQGQRQLIQPQKGCKQKMSVFPANL